MSRPRIVLDTSVLVSAALKPLGPPAQVFHMIAFGAVELCVSKDVLAEYREVLARPNSPTFECADAFAADYIVTGNLEHFTQPYKNTKIINARQFLEILQPEEE